MTIKKFLSLFICIAWISTIDAQSLINKTLQWDGNNREYAIYIPASYDGSIEFPLLFNFHGGGGSNTQHMALVDMRPIADTANFILVYPQAFPDPTDGGSTNWIRKSPTTFDDVPFVEAMIDSISVDYKINSNRIYACGYSLGGEITYELGCSLNNRFAAISAVARTMGTDAFDNCSPVHPTGVLTILGTEDKISPYKGLVWGGTKYYLSADEVHNYWVGHNNCNTTPVVTTIANTNTSDGSTVERYTWANSDGCTYIEHLKVINGGHDWPGSFGNMDIDASQEIWNFVSRYDIYGLIGCATVSINENISPNKGYKVYPNPFEKVLNIEIGLAEDKKYKVCNTIGEMVLRGNLNSELTSIDLSYLPSGIYVLSFENQSIKLIKMK